MKTKLTTLAFIFLTLIWTSCSDSDNDEITPDPPPTSGDVTYTNSIKSIVSGNCLSCHGSSPTNGAPMSLTTYTMVKDAALNRGLITLVENGTMPKDGSLSTAQKKAFSDWKSDGYLE
ncbi:MAG: hypothetical protein COB60_09310 [Flavobacteriaceae bacterium]|nr:MAG: hypothetical protein COB60_09310 [Flavobacteriaceae bacterium]